MIVDLIQSLAIAWLCIMVAFLLIRKQNKP